MSLLPKDLLTELESGDRTMEHLEAKKSFTDVPAITYEQLLQTYRITGNLYSGSFQNYQFAAQQGSLSDFSNTSQLRRGTQW